MRLRWKRGRFCGTAWRKRMEEIGIGQAAVEEICSLARKHHIKKVVLFGSRARGDYQRASDIDLAVCGGNGFLFALDVEEMTSTPLKYDIVNLDEPVQEDLRESIRAEGIVLYEEI